MAIEVKKKQGETTRSLLRRFSRRIQQSGLLIRARKSRFKEREKSKRERRTGALRREHMGKKMEKMRKMGLLEEEPRYKGRR